MIDLLRRLACGAIAGCCALIQPADAGTVLDRVRSAKVVTCGIDTDEADYSEADTHGNLAALGADICRAVAVATLGPGAVVKAVKYLDEPSGLAALKSGKIDLLAGATPSLQNAAIYGAAFGPVVFYDAQGFMVAKTSGIHTLRDLAGRQVCTISESPADHAMQTALKQRHIAYQPFPFEEIGEMQAAFLGGHCQALTGDISALADTRPLFHKQADDFTILPETITTDPLAPAYAAGDAEWAAIVNWTMAALIQAEEDGITQANVDAMKDSDNPDIRLLRGAPRGVGHFLGLDEDWAARAIRAVGNYGEIFDRDVGLRSPLRLPRGQNALWTKGGLIYAPPLL
jgi:general L-amino acid transport system substrate-binding protein